MKINNVVRVANGNLGRSIAFNRKLKEEEKKDYTKTINDTMDYLGVVNRAMIIHGSSFPSDISKDIETKIGSPYGAENFLDFIQLHGFNAVQLGPTGKLNRGDTSPYSSSVFAKNPLFIDLSQLTEPEYASILSEDDIFEETYAVEKTDKNYTKTDFKEAQEIYDITLKRAYKNFQRKLGENDKNAQTLNKEFQLFQHNNAQWLEYYSVLDVIASGYGTDYYPNWEKEDAQLIQNVKKGDSDALQRYTDIRNKNKDQIQSYKFTQFLIDKQSRQDDINRGRLTYISDLLVGVSSFDEMIYGDIFKKGYKIGAEAGGLFNSPQLWDIAMIDPDRLFKQDGTLDEGGRFLKLKLKKAMSDATNVRIDHAMGLVDPYIYKPESIVYGQKKNEKGELVKYPIREKLQAGYLSQTGIDKNHNYERIIPEIIIPTMQELELNPQDAVWEDLGSDVTGVFNRVFRKENNLPGINVLAWERGEESKPTNWAYVNGHDNPPTMQNIQKGDVKGSHAWNLDYLAGYLNPSPKRVKEREQFKKEIETNPKALLKAKFADLFRSTKNIQISFMDFFGINKQYNIPGTTGNHNWTLRLNPNYEDTYYKSLSENENALNMPEVLSIALQAKSDMDIVKGEKTELQSTRETKPLLRKLEHYGKILKEKE